MTREQYLKHKEVMDQFYHQPECTAIWCKNCSGWVKTTRPSWFLESTYVINDKYIDLRKAVVDGETIQWEQTENNWIDLPKNYDFIKAEENGATIEEYRIKPEEPKFKTGDWVRVKEAPADIYKIADIDSNEIYGTNCIGYNTSEQIELWEPKKGEWCWIGKAFAKFIEKDTDSNYVGICYQYSDKVYDKHIEPFIGELPTKYKNR